MRHQAAFNACNGVSKKHIAVRVARGRLDAAVVKRERPPAGERGVQYQTVLRYCYTKGHLRMIADATIRRFLRNNNADQDQDCTKEDEETLWEMTRGVTCCRFGFSAVGFKARFSPSKRLQLKDRLPYFEPQPHPTTRGGYMPSIVATRYTEQSRVLLDTIKAEALPNLLFHHRCRFFKGFARV